ncbi:MAG: hypothetical protein AAF149_09105, partial [Bacteroidota bacterium]
GLALKAAIEAKAIFTQIPHISEPYKTLKSTNPGYLSSPIPALPIYIRKDIRKKIRFRDSTRRAWARV